MDSGEGAAARSLLPCTRITGLLSEDAALSDENNVPVGELFLQLTSQSGFDLILEGDSKEKEAL